VPHQRHDAAQRERLFARSIMVTEDSIGRQRKNGPKSRGNRFASRMPKLDQQR
jgi:hypothetical protein